MAVPLSVGGSSTGVESRSAARESARRAGPRAGAALRHVTACVDGSEASRQVLRHAWAVARALRLPVSVLHVVETDDSRGPADPLEWELRRLEARHFLDEATASLPDLSGNLEIELRQGNAAEQILRWAAAHDGELTVLCRHGRHGRAEWALSSTARKLVEVAPGSLLIVPDGSAGMGEPIRYRRVLVPVDGSLRAESALAAAMDIARAHDAELLIAHAVPAPELTQPGPPTPEDLEIERQVVARNEQVARDYLRRVRSWLSERAVPVRAFTLHGGEVRERLCGAIARERADLVVLSAHGRTSPRGAPCGSVASYLLSHVPVPMLVLRERHRATASAASPTGAGGEPRHPARAS